MEPFGEGVGEAAAEAVVDEVGEEEEVGDGEEAERLLDAGIGGGAAAEGEDDEVEDEGGEDDQTVRKTRR
ncbi:MAG: hypothetical protein R3F65_29880 [bacterium]